MPIPVPSLDVRETSIFPTLSRADIDSARLSSWYPLFRRLTFPSTIIDLDTLDEKAAFLEASLACVGCESRSDASSSGLTRTQSSCLWSVIREFLFARLEMTRLMGRLTDPTAENDEDAASTSSSSGSGSAPRARRDSDAGSSSSESEAPVYSLPKLTGAIEKAIKTHGGTVFPKLNWTSPRDAAFIIPQTRGPLCCSTPADIYLLLKSSDLIQHDLDPLRAYLSSPPDHETDQEGEPPAAARGEMKIELVLRSFGEMNPAREMRCFVRQNILLGISQRDTNYYDHFQPPETREMICDTVRAFWEDEIRTRYQGGEDSSADAVDVFDIYLSSDYDSAYLVDFNPYRPSTDPLLFTYPDLLDTLHTALRPPPTLSPSSTTAAPSSARQRLPILRVIDSQAHPMSNSVAPTYGSNMMPVEMVEMSQGRNMGDFSEAWNEAVARGMQD